MQAKPTSYTIDTGSAYRPTHLWMLDEGTGTTAADQGSATALDATLVSASQWTTDASADALGTIMECSSTNGWHALTATTTSLITASACMVAIVRVPSIQDATRYIFSMADATASPVADRALIGTNVTTGYLSGSVYSDTTDNSGKTHTTNIADNAWHMVAMKFRENGVSQEVIGLSVDGGAWQTNNDTLGDVACTRYGLGCRATVSGPTQFNGYLAAAWVYHDPVYTDLNDGWINALWNAGDPWSVLTNLSATKYLKILADASAASATGVEGVVYNAPSGSDYVFGTTRYGDFTGKSFEASLEGGNAVLKILASEVGCSGLAAGATPTVVVRNSTNTSDVFSATIIEE